MHLYHDPRAHGPLTPNRAFYDRLGRETSRRTLAERIVVPVRTGRAWTVKKGQIFRVVAIEGAQVGDFNVWNSANPRERFWSTRTRQIEGCHLTKGSRLWSCLPYLRPILTITEDTLPRAPTQNGGRYHGLLGSRCDPFIYKLVDGRDVADTCHNNLTRAVAPYHLTEMDVHDALNIFQVTGLDSDLEIAFTEASRAKKGDFLEFFAEIDVLCAISNCRCGDSSVVLRGLGRGDPTATCKPLGIEIYDVDPALLEDWTPTESPKVGSMY